MNVLVIPEDFRKDQYILKPIIEAMFAEIDQELNPKEVYFEPFAKRLGVIGGPGQGRKALAREASRNYGRIRSFCTEDVGALETRLRERV